ncbi:CAP domain-containing protein [Micromonospora sp. WMMD961]|uniref:CAP domain-containing protein n=1 Tax=Micromonospora sp. WMMD961 TaxID=3016100 RepID=UPI002415E3C7|nr:CAP domain-containing protein [Micromonospora sp. WMMD961]MDG4779661.1 CAP domain-containing protein [Micromonospora sp. WMMD961]
MYGWTDPMDPNGAPRRAERPTDEPAWLHDRPEPRSAYLFGDDADQPGDEWHPQPPADGWRSGRPTAAGSADAPTAAWPAHHPGGDSGHWGDSHPIENPAGDWPTDGGPATTGDWPTDPGTTAGWRTEAGTAGRPGEGRHRSPRRWRKPMMIGGAAAAATLVVSFGVGALAMPGGEGGVDQPTAVDDTFAASQAPTEPPAIDTLAAPSPSAAPSSAQPSPSPSKVVKPTPAQSRTTAASRRGAERSTAPSTTSGSGSGGSSGTVSSQAREVVDLVNAERAKAGCKALSIDDKLMTAAQKHSQDQADHQNMSHTGSDGSNAGVRLDRVGYAWRTYGENVAWNQKTPTSVMDAWMNSSGHRANILNCAFTEIGVGIANSNGPYWTQVFAAPR